MTPRQLTLLTYKFPFVTSLSAAVADWRKSRWLRRHPHCNFTDYYVAINESRINSGKPHPTLGLSGYRGVGKQAVEWTPESFRERGVDIWEVYRVQGLTPSMRTVDYGCGSLRIGQHAIDYLDSGAYCGIDPSSKFVAEGVLMLNPATIASKRPWLGKVDRETIAEVRLWKPQFVFSHAVVQHIPRSELPRYFERLDQMMASSCKAVIMFVCAEKERRLKAMSWAYPEGLLRGIAAAAVRGGEIRFSSLPPGKERTGGGNRRLMIIERDESVRE